MNLMKSDEERFSCNWFLSRCRFPYWSIKWNGINETMDTPFPEQTKWGYIIRRANVQLYLAFIYTYFWVKDARACFCVSVCVYARLGLIKVFQWALAGIGLLDPIVLLSKRSLFQRSRLVPWLRSGHQRRTLDNVSKCRWLRKSPLANCRPCFRDQKCIENFLLIRFLCTSANSDLDFFLTVNSWSLRPV